MASNYGKKFEQLIREAFLKVPGVSIDRIPDQTMRYKGACNISDFIVYKYPFEFYIECKTVHGSSLPFTNISNNQWEGMLEKSVIPGVYAGVICWWVDKNTTLFLPISLMQECRNNGWKSINYVKAQTMLNVVSITGKKKRVFYEYDMEQFFKEVTK